MSIDHVPPRVDLHAHIHFSDFSALVVQAHENGEMIRSLVHIGARLVKQADELRQEMQELNSGFQQLKGTVTSRLDGFATSVATLGAQVTALQAQVADNADLSSAADEIIAGANSLEAEMSTFSAQVAGSTPHDPVTDEHNPGDTTSETGGGVLSDGTVVSTTEPPADGGQVDPGAGGA